VGTSQLWLRRQSTLTSVFVGSLLLPEFGSERTVVVRGMDQGLCGGSRAVLCISKLCSQSHSLHQGKNGPEVLGFHCPEDKNRHLPLVLSARDLE
jgi:hypothetical protein